MRIVVCGGRDYENKEHLSLVLRRLSPRSIAHGNARGADSLAHLWCIDWQVPVVPFLADWEMHGKSAGPKRNREMLEDFQPDLVVAFKCGRGTEDCIKAARERGIPVLRVEEP